MRLGVKGGAAADAAAMYTQTNPGAITGPPVFGPGTVSRKMVIIWGASALWLFFVGYAARSY